MNYGEVYITVLCKDEQQRDEIFVNEQLDSFVDYSSIEEMQEEEVGPELMFAVSLNACTDLKKLGSEIKYNLGVIRKVKAILRKYNIKEEDIHFEGYSD